MTLAPQARLSGEKMLAESLVGILHMIIGDKTIIMLMVLHNGFTLIIDNVLITAEHSPVVKIIKVSQYKEKNQYN